jgi:hypothetical protein
MRLALPFALVLAAWHGATAVRYLDNEGMVADCRSAGGVPRGAPVDWAKLPANLARFLCGFGG